MISGRIKAYAKMIVLIDLEYDSEENCYKEKHEQFDNLYQGKCIHFLQKYFFKH